MSSYESTAPGRTLDSGQVENMENSFEGFLGDYLQPAPMLGVGQGAQAPSPVWSTGSPFPSFMTSSGASSMYGVSPRPECANLGPLWPSPESDFGLGQQLQEAANTKLLDELSIPAVGYDLARNPSQDFLASQKSLPAWNSHTQTPQPSWFISPPVPEPALIGGGESETGGFPAGPSPETRPLPSLSSTMLSSPMQERDELNPSKVKEESASNRREGSGSSISNQKWVAQRTLSKNKRPSRTKSRNGGSRRDSNQSIQSDLEDEDYGSSSDYTRGKSRTRAFACPFYRMDPMRHMECVNFKLSRIRDVKQHINRRHTTGPHYCPECWSTFQTAEPWEAHIKSRSCNAPVSGSRTSILGVSNDMREDLAKRVDKMLSPPEQWYTILRILFKGTTKEPDPYLGTVVEETVGMMRDHWRQDGADIVRHVLEQNGKQGRFAEFFNLMNEVFGEAQVRFEQKTRQPDALESNNPQQSNLPPGSDTTMTETQARSLQNDWLWVNKEPNGPQSEMISQPNCSWGSAGNQVPPDILQTSKLPGFVNANNLASFAAPLGERPARWVAENHSHEQAMDESGSQQKFGF